MKNRIELLAFLLSVLAITRFAFAGEGKTYRIPFHTVNSVALLDATVNGNSAVLLLDTGADYTLISLQASGLTTAKLRAL